MTDSNGWTPERRAKQAAAIHKWKPWLSSTGPRSAEGKKTSSSNAERPNSFRRQLLDMVADIKDEVMRMNRSGVTQRRRQPE